MKAHTDELSGLKPLGVSTKPNSDQTIPSNLLDYILNKDTKYKQAL